MLDFIKDVEKGKIGEERFLKLFNEKVDDVRLIQWYQRRDIDFVTKDNKHLEVKYNFNHKNIIIEEYTDILTNKKGWFYNCEADYIYFVSKTHDLMLELKFNDEFKEFYENLKPELLLVKNQKSFKGDKTWQSAFYKIELEQLRPIKHLLKIIK